MHEPAAMRPERAQLRVAVQHLGNTLEAVERARTVGVPPRNGNTAGIRVDELYLRALVQPVLAVCPPEARLLDAAPRRGTGTVRVAEVVRPHHAGFDPCCDPARTVGVARPYARTEPERRRVCELNGLVLAVECAHGDDGAEDLLAVDPRRRVAPGQHRRLVEPAGEVQ